MVTKPAVCPCCGAKNPPSNAWCGKCGNEIEAEGRQDAGTGITLDSIRDVVGEELDKRGVSRKPAKPGKRKRDEEEEPEGDDDGLGDD